MKKLRSLRLGVRTPGFHPGNRGSIPLGTANAPPLGDSDRFFILIFRGNAVVLCA